MIKRDLIRANVFCAALCATTSMHSAIATELPIALADIDNHVVAFTPNNTNLTHSNRLDALTEQTLERMLSGDWVTATQLAEKLVESFPDFALGQLILAETHTVSALSEPLLSSLPDYSTVLIDLLLEARARLQRLEPSGNAVSNGDNQLPTEIVQVGKHIDHVVLVDLSTSNLYLFDTTTAMPKLIKKHYISSGSSGFGKLFEGDLKTPLGIYRIHGFRSDDSLPSLYGSGALMLNYPNALDRSLGRSGSGIWLHGNPPSNRSRSPRSSEGCVTMANDHLLDLSEQINLSRTSVVLTDSIQWQNLSHAAIQRDRFQELFNQYRNAWLSNDIVDLVSLYMPDALPSSIRYAGGASARKAASEISTYSQLLAPAGIDLNALKNTRISDITLMLNPSSEDAQSHLVMDFELGDSSSTRITLYWEQNTAGFWQIKREEIDAGGV